MQGNQFQEILDILRRRAWQIVLPALVGLAIGNTVGKLVPHRYSTSTQLELRETNMPSTGEGVVAQTLMRDVESAQYHIKARERVRRVIEKLEWQDFTSLTTPEQGEYLTKIIGRIKVVTVVARKGGSSFITIRYADTDADRAEQFVNRLRDAYTSEVVERFRNDARAVRDTMQNQLALAQEDYRDKEKLAAELRRKNGLSNTQQAPGGGRVVNEDPVYAQLTQTREELRAVLLKANAEEAALAVLEEQYADAPREVPQETITGGMDFAGQLTAIETDIQNFKDQQVGIKPAHSVWQRAETEIRKLEEKRATLMARAIQPQNDVQLVLNPRREQLHQQIENKELLIVQLKAQAEQLTRTVTDLTDQHQDLSAIYREIQQLDNEVARTRDNYNRIAMRHDAQVSFVELINQPHANPFIVSEEADAPTEHSTQNELLVLIIGLVIGLTIGIAMALIGEFGHNGYRSVTDIGRSLAVPVLGVVNAIVTREEARRSAARRAMVTVSTLVLVFAIVWVTWAYENAPRLLGSELTTFIDGIRASFT